MAAVSILLTVNEFCYWFLVSIATAIIEILWAVLNSLWRGGGSHNDDCPVLCVYVCVCVCVCVA